MSYQSWHEYGYGICMDDISTTVDKVFELVHMAPKFEKKFQKWVEDYKADNDVEVITMYDIYEEWDDDSCCEYGLGPIMSAVVQECEDIELLCCSDYNGTQYLIFSTAYSWTLTDKEKSMSKEDVRLLIEKYVNILTNDVVKIEYQSVENGG